MCYRFYVPGRDDPEYAGFLSSVRDPGQIKQSGEVFPTDTVAVLANNRKNTPAAFSMQWGYTAFGKRIFNTRSETAAEKQLFRDGITCRRCLIPAACYFEWDKEKTKYEIGASRGGLIWLAGIYRFEEDRPVFSILTKQPTPELRRIHSRMPVIMPPEAKAAWLQKDADPDSLLRSALRELRFVPVPPDRSLSDPSAEETDNESRHENIF